MNDPGDPVPTTSASAAQVAECPRCGTQLRLARAISDQTPIKCFSCQAVFCLAPIDTAPVATAAVPVSPLPLPAPQPVAAPRMPEFTSAPFPLSNKPHAQVVPPSYASPAAAAMPRMTTPVSVPAIPAGFGSPAATRLHSPTLPLAPPLAAPPAPAVAASSSGTAAPKPRKVLQLGPQETIIASVLLVALLAGAVAGGIMLTRGSSTDPENSAPDASALASRPNAIGNPFEQPAIKPDWRKTIPTAPSLPEDVVAKTAALVGFWESRADDGSVSTLELRADESATLLRATDEPDLTPQLQGRWALIRQEGNAATLDIIYTTTGLEVHRMTINLQLPDAFTITTSAFRGVVHTTDQRYVRRKTAPVAGSP